MAIDNYEGETLATLIDLRLRLRAHVLATHFARKYAADNNLPFDLVYEKLQPQMETLLALSDAKAGPNGGCN